MSVKLPLALAPSIVPSSRAWIAPHKVIVCPVNFIDLEAMGTAGPVNTFVPSSTALAQLTPTSIDKEATAPFTTEILSV